MKLVTAIIQSHQLDSARKALTTSGFSVMTISAVRGAGRHQGVTAMYRGNIYKDEFTDSVQISIALEDEKVADIITIFRETIGEGKGVLWVTPLETMIHFNKKEISA